MTRNEAREVVKEIAPGVTGAYEQMLIRAVLAGANREHKTETTEETYGSWAELRERYSDIC